MERNVALRLMYNGTAYHGWQVQKNAISVAETLEKALAATVGPVDYAREQRGYMRRSI